MAPRSNRTWLKLAAPAKAGDTRVTLEQAVSDWQVGDRIIITTGELRGPDAGRSFRQGSGRPKQVGTEERHHRGHRRCNPHAGSSAQ